MLFGSDGVWYARPYGIRNVDGRLVTPDDDCDRDDSPRGSDVLSKLRERYLAAGPAPSNARHGWMRRT